VTSQAPLVKVDPKENVLKEGEQFDFICKVEREIDTCFIEFVASSEKFKIFNNTKKDDFEYNGEGFKKGDCGISYNKIKKEHHGKVTCIVGYPDIDFESVGETNLIVAIPPTDVELKVSDAYKEGDEMSINCSALGGRPAPTVTILLGK